MWEEEKAAVQGNYSKAGTHREPGFSLLYKREPLEVLTVLIKTPQAAPWERL
jgi:hypothetical protein